MSVLLFPWPLVLTCFLFWDGSLKARAEGKAGIAWNIGHNGKPNPRFKVWTMEQIDRVITLSETPLPQ